MVSFLTKYLEMDSPINSIMTRSLAPTVEQYNADAAIKIDWFNFETRMRSLIKEMLDPCIDSTSDINKEIKNINTNVIYMQGQIQELEFQITKQDVIFKKLDDLENFFNNERQAKDLDIQRLQSEVLAIRPELLNHQDQLQKADEQRDKLKKEINISNNKLIAHREDMLNNITNTSTKLMHELSIVLMKITEEEDKRKDFEFLIENFKTAVEKHDISKFFISTFFQI